MFTLDDPIALTAELIGIDTSNGAEDGCTGPLARQLQHAGLDVTMVESEPGRTNLVATWRGGGGLVLSAHVDTVPFTAAEWTYPPLSGEVVGDRIYGRGASDMKGGLAAMVVAACQAAGEGGPPFTLLVTIGEELGCQGADDVVGRGVLGESSVFVIGESTGNALRFGHKGATWLRLTCRGRAAHGSQPELGTNAVVQMMRVIQGVCAGFDFPAHEQLGKATVNVGTFAGGVQPNIVPDLATAELDFRTVPGVDGSEIRMFVQDHQPDVLLDELLDLSYVWTDPISSLSRQLRQTVASVTGEADTEPAGVPYFTDGSLLRRVPGSHVYICGPGDPSEPHTANESCSIAGIHEAQAIYRRLIEDAGDLARRAADDVRGDQA